MAHPKFIIIINMIIIINLSFFMVLLQYEFRIANNIDFSNNLHRALHRGYSCDLLMKHNAYISCCQK